MRWTGQDVFGTTEPRRNTLETPPTKNPESSQPTPSSTLVSTSFIIYGAMICVGLLMIHFAHDQLAQRFAWTLGAQEWGRTLAIAALGTGVLLVLSYFFEEYAPSFRALQSAFALILGRISIPTAVYLAAVSSLGEEILFRGAIQPSLGLLGTSILFGLLHVGPTGVLSSWSLWAVLAGLLLGWMSDALGTLWAPILCHFLVNLTSMIRLRMMFQSYEKRNLARKDAPFVKEP